MNFYFILILIIKVSSFFYQFESISISNIFNDQKNSLWNILSFWKQSKQIPSKNYYHEDANLMTHQLIAKYKYPSEVHNVTTEDGYILSLHRIAKPGNQPIFLMHGILDSSAAFVIMGPNISLGYLLFDKGYDVWLGNARGNRYSRSHINIKPTNNKFWDFSWHEIGFYDLPAMINYIRKNTTFDALYYVGHSQGATAFFVMCSMKPEFNDKIILMKAFAPIAFMNNIKTPLAKSIDLYLKSDKSNAKTELMPQGWFDQSKCLTNKIYQWFCLEIIFSLIGENAEQLNESMLPIIFSHIPAGGSIKQIHHYAQNYKSKEFSTYYYSNRIDNIFYNQTRSKKYNLSKIIAPVIMYYALNDYLSAPEDIHRLYQELGNIKGLYQITDFNHMDFVWAKDLRKNFFENIFLKILNDFISGTLKYVIE